MVNAFRTIHYQEGTRGLYKGFGVTMVGYIPAEMIYYTVYEFGKRFMKDGYRKLNNWSLDRLPNVATVGMVYDILCWRV